MTTAEREAIELHAILLSAERWSGQYLKSPTQHAKMLKTAAKFNLILRRYFHDMALKAPDFINQYAYRSQVRPKLANDPPAFNVDVIINDGQIDNYDDNLIQISLKTIGDAIAIGAQAGEDIYGVPLGIQSTDAIMQQLTTKQIAALVGKKVNADGSIVDNPNAAYNINDTVRNDIAESIKTSLALGETTDEAIARMQDIIDNPARAERIVNTEMVNAYTAGLSEFGDQSGAVGKAWDDADAIDICADYASQDPIAIDDTWDDLDGPPAHPNCLCSLRLIYQEEADNEGYSF